MIAGSNFRFKWRHRHRGRIAFPAHPLLFVTVLFLFVANLSVEALEVPPLRGRVNDLAGMLPSDRAAALETRLAEFEQQTRHQIVVLTIPSLQGDPIGDAE